MLLRYVLSSSIIISLFTLFSEQVVGMDESPIDYNKERNTYSCPNLLKLDEGFYAGRMRSPAGKEQWIVVEQVTKENHDLWKRYIHIQTNLVYAERDPRGKLQTGATFDGSQHFKRVLNEISPEENEIFVGYITNAEQPKKINDSQGGLGQYAHSVGYYDCPFAENIEMFVTMVSHPEALVTSNMGIASSLECLETRQKGTSLDLLSCTAKVAKMRNPNRKVMINAPVYVIENLTAKELPDSTFVGTREQRENMQKVQGIGKKEFSYLKGDSIKEKIQARAMKEVSAENSSLEDDIRALREGKIQNETEDSLRQKASQWLPEYSFVEMGSEGKFVISESKIESRYSKALEDEFVNFKNPCQFPPHPREKASVEFLKFMEQHPPILSGSPYTSFTIFDPNKPDTPWLTFNNSHKAYSWMKDPFVPAGNTHYMAVELDALAKCRSLIPIDYKDMGSPFNIIIDNKQYTDGEGNFVQDLKNNASVVELTIDTDINYVNNTQFNNYLHLIREGLQNKPHLRSLRIKGNFNVDTWLHSHDISLGDKDICPQKLLNAYPHLEIFTHLDELHIEGNVIGKGRNNAYFLGTFILYLQKEKNLKTFTYTK